MPADNQATMTMALICGDASWSRNVASYAAATAAARAKYPLSDGMPDNIWPCAFWSKAPVEPPVKVTSSGPRDILLLQNRRDNATPWQAPWAWTRHWAHRAGFVGVDNGGHYVYDTGSACADQATNAFLTKGTLPASRCTAPPPRPDLSLSACARRLGSAIGLGFVAVWRPLLIAAFGGYSFSWAHHWSCGRTLASVLAVQAGAAVTEELMFRGVASAGHRAAVGQSGRGRGHCAVLRRRPPGQPGADAGERAWRSRSRRG